MIRYCDYCRKLIVPMDGNIEDDDNIWNKEYNKRMKVEISKRKGIKKILFRAFNFVNMPFYPSETFQFCSKGCYEAWKKKASVLFALHENMGVKKNGD